MLYVSVSVVLTHPMAVIYIESSHLPPLASVKHRGRLDKCSAMCNPFDLQHMICVISYEL